MGLLNQTFQQYYDALIHTDKLRALAVVDQALEKGITPEEVVFEMVIPGIDRMVSDLTVSMSATIAQHFVASQIAEEVTSNMVEKFAKKAEVRGTVVLGTSRGDFHGLGKKIVGGCLRAHMFCVVDLGINVSADTFVGEAKAKGAQIIGISSMMIHTATGENGAKKVRQLLREQGLENQIKLIVGGAPYHFDENLYKTVGADGWGENGPSAAELAKRFMEEMQRNEAESD